jgi:hypothetical protein
MGFCGMFILLILPIDKLAGLWYNGNYAPGMRGRRDKKVNRQNAQKKILRFL